MIAMRYGSVPVVRRTGGLNDRYILSHQSLQHCWHLQTCIDNAALICFVILVSSISTMKRYPWNCEMASPFWRLMSRWLPYLCTSWANVLEYMIFWWLQTANVRCSSQQGFDSALERAFNYYHRKPEVWKQLVQKDMKIDFSWDTSASQYEDIYQRAAARARAAT